MKNASPSKDDGQNNSWACGYFTCLAAKLLIHNESLQRATRLNIEAFRVEMIEHILAIPYVLAFNSEF